MDHAPDGEVKSVNRGGCDDEVLVVHDAREALEGLESPPMIITTPAKTAMPWAQGLTVWVLAIGVLPQFCWV